MHLAVLHCLGCETVPTALAEALSLRPLLDQPHEPQAQLALAAISVGWLEAVMSVWAAGMQPAGVAPLQLAAAVGGSQRLHVRSADLCSEDMLVCLRQHRHEIADAGDGQGMVPSGGCTSFPGQHQQQQQQQHTT